MGSILITGASSGIGKAVAERFLEQDWNVALIARRKQLLEDIAGDRAHAFPIVCDVTQPGDVEAAFAEFAEKVGAIDVLFNNAGIFTTQALIDDIPLDDWTRALSVNLTGMYLCAREAFKQMRHQTPMGGRIINNGSISAHVPREGAATYTITKHGVTGLTRQLALDGREFDIACGQIDIGNARTDMVQALIDKAKAQNTPEPPSFDVKLVADAVFQMAALPLDTNVLFQTIMATQMPYVGRG